MNIILYGEQQYMVSMNGFHFRFDWWGK